MVGRLDLIIMAPLGRTTVPRLSAAQPFSHAADEATSAWPASLDTQILGIQVRWMNRTRGNCGRRRPSKPEANEDHEGITRPYTLYAKR
ncbi:hypothetical protein HBH98_010320 [Parastagonospora nodorum]|nr:hypothetical protein HBH53_004030 [Parastagonospora nodorum]KAH3977059.1 hypothetical protein HBH51_077500 [Parastagonospora nodorum]KAH4041067.1 hypothetical protein HBI09_017570 [Parastagonospora nodorum]KAH4132990.1 hypothetical protein HBH47_008100 [Parastagonospora nodorum]KAH4177955.1 hypothetical protein HBH43_038480 [Parastagonospora nodorum]